MVHAYHLIRVCVKVDLQERTVLVGVAMVWTVILLRYALQMARVSLPRRVCVKQDSMAQIARVGAVTESL